MAAQPGIHSREGSIMTGWPSIHLDRQASVCHAREGSIVAGRDKRLVSSWQTQALAYENSTTLAQHNPQLALSMKSLP